MIKIERRDIDIYANSFLLKVDPNKNRRKRTLYHKLFLENIKEIVLCKPEKFQDWIDEFNKLPYDNTIFSDFKTYMENQYKSIINEHGHWLADKLSVNVCPYCNRQYTFTVENANKKIRPQFDHFMNKAKYPYFALSFYNLIPSCPVCNLVKKEDELILHPYVEGFGDNCKFAIDYIERCLLTGIKDNWNIILTNSDDKYRKNNESFLLQELYNKHKDYVSEIVHKTRMYNLDYYSSLVESFTELGLNAKEINLIIFGNYIYNEDLELRPLAKLTKDIIDQIGLKPIL